MSKSLLLPSCSIPARKTVFPALPGFGKWVSGSWLGIDKGAGSGSGILSFNCRRASGIFISPLLTASAKSGACSLMRLASAMYCRFVPTMAAAWAAAVLLLRSSENPLLKSLSKGFFCPGLPVCQTPPLPPLPPTAGRAPLRPAPARLPAPQTPSARCPGAGGSG